MARPKEFDRDVALSRAIDVFANFGYEGASTEALLGAMGVSRQSLYDTFGSKWELYLEAVRRYNRESSAEIINDLKTATTALEGLQAALVSFVNRTGGRPSSHCLGVSSVSEFGSRHPEITAIAEEGTERMLGPVAQAFAQAQRDGEIRDDVDPGLAAAFFMSNLAGLKISARAGASPELLLKVGKLALEAFRPIHP